MKSAPHYLNDKWRYQDSATHADAEAFRRRQEQRQREAEQLRREAEEQDDGYDARAHQAAYP